MTATGLSAVAANDSKIDEISNLSLTSAQTASEITTLLGKSVAAASTGKAMAVADATSMDVSKLNALGNSYAKLAANGITGDVALSGGSSGVTDANITNLFAKISLTANVRFDGTGSGASTLSIVSTNIAKVDSALSIAFTNSQTVTELANLLGKSDVASDTADATGMDSNVGGQLATIADNSTKLVNGGLTGAVSINANLTATQIANLLSKLFTGSSFVGGTSVTINASGMSSAQLSAIASAVGSISDPTTANSIYDITNLALNASQTSSEIATLLNVTNANQATVNATGMSQAQLGAVGNDPNAVNQITGTITITADLTAAQIAAIMGNAAPSAVVNVDSNGMSSDQQAAVLSTAVMVVSTDSVVATGNTFTVDVDVSGLSADAVGMQARVMYDASKLQYVASSSVGGTDMPTQVFATAGSGYVTFATGVDFTGSGAGIRSGNVAKLTFRAIVPFCDATNLVWLATSGFNNRITTGDATPALIPFTATNFSNVTSLNNLQLAGVPSNTSLPADAGTVAGAAVANPGVTASNNCTSVPVTFSITYPNASTGTTWPARFPVGVSTITWSTIDDGGNTASATRTVTVFNYQLATIDVNLVGGINPNLSFTQTVRVHLSSGASVNTVVSFTGNNGALVDAQIPVRDDYTCITVKDATHTLSAAQTLSVSGTKYVASGSFELIGGDANDDNMVDILDFGTFVADRGAGKNANSRSNYDRNVVVNNGDFSYISINFLLTGADCAGGNFNGQGPLTQVSVKDLRRAGLGHLAVADINNDGWVDQTDIGLAIQGVYRPDVANPLDPADEVELNTAW